VRRKENLGDVAKSVHSGTTNSLFVSLQHLQELKANTHPLQTRREREQNKQGRVEANAAKYGISRRRRKERRGEKTREDKRRDEKRVEEERMRREKREETGGNGGGEGGEGEEER